jgi:hypothetical protein
MRAARIAQRVAASPFPVTPDMKAFTEEVLGFVRRAVDPQENISFAPGGKPQRLYAAGRVVQGPYGRAKNVRVYLETTDDSIHGHVYIRELAQGDTVNVYVFAPFAALIAYSRRRVRREVVGEIVAMTREAILHELIHVFDPKMNRPDLLQKFSANAQYKVPYTQQAVEETATVGALVGRVELFKKKGLSKEYVFRWVSRLADEDRLELRDKTLEAIVRDPRRKKELLARLYKIVERVYAA